ncbi:MAG: hypothetical protein ABIR38_02765 [Chthoniobacterales bacterium]
MTPTPSATPTPSITPTPGPTATPSPTVSGEALLNISTRARSQTGDNVLIGGFILGDSSAAKNVVVRALGPSLSPAVVNPLTDPSLQLFNSSGALISSNDDWMDGPNAQQIIDSGLAPLDSREAAIYTTLGPGAYTTVVPGVDGTDNVALVEVYDLNSVSTPGLLNISTRGSVGTADQVMIAGVIVGGTTTKVVVVRGLGPSLASAVANPLPNPTLSLFNNFGQQIATNDDWQDTQASDISGSGLAPAGPLESTILALLPPGSYTAILSDVNGFSGVGLIEIYNITSSQ